MTLAMPTITGTETAIDVAVHPGATVARGTQAEAAERQACRVIRAERYAIPLRTDLTWMR